MEKVLVAYDGSDMSKAALEEAESIIKMKPDTSLHVVSVISLVGPTTYYALATSVTTEIAESMRSELNQLQEELLEKGIQSRSEVIVDYNQRNPGVRICKYAEDQEVDLIIAGSRGLGAMSRFFLGSVSTYIVHHASCKVLLIK